MKCCKVQCGTALSVINAIKWSAETVMEFNTFLSKLVTMGSDVASVMLGKKSGVLALLKEQQPSLIDVHCSGHRLELCYKDAMKKVLMAEKVLTLLWIILHVSKQFPQQNQLEECILVSEHKH